MASSTEFNSRLLTRAIISISLFGIVYFGYSAIFNDSGDNQGNPFEYNLENFKKFDPDLLHYTEISQIPLNFKHTTGIAIDLEDNIYVTGDNSVLILNKEGKIQSAFSVNEKAYCIAADESGGLYLGMMDHIEIYDQKGIRKARWESPGDEAIITSIAVSKEFVFVADAGYQTVWKYDKNGSVIMQIGEEDRDKDIPGYIIPSPFFDVCIDPDGFLWVANTGLHSLENYTFEGDLRSSWGEYSIEIEGFCGCCNPTHIAILDDGKFITSEKGLARVKVYNRLGQLESVVAGPDQFIDGTDGLDLTIDSKGRIYVIDPKKKAVRIFEKNKI